MAEIRCTTCGTLNRVANYSLRQIPQCGKCHASLPEGLSRKTVRGFYQWRRYFAWLAVLASPLLFFAWAGSGQHVPTAEKVVACIPQPNPIPGDYLISDPSPRVAPFSVETRAGFDYLVKLENANDWALTLLFYVRGGQPFETTVPLGTYLLKYVAGNKWCGASQMFGNTIAEKGRTLLIFSHTDDGYDGHTVTLYTLPHGNFETEVIPREQF